MKTHKQKMVAPIVATVLMIAYYVVYFAFLISFLDGMWRYVFGIVPAIFAAITIYVCAQRIHEIKKGEEDDLSQY